MIMCVDKDDYDKNPKKYNDIRDENQKTSIFPIEIRLIDKNAEKIPLTDLIPRIPKFWNDTQINE